MSRKKPRMEDWHRMFVQSVMSRGYMTGAECFNLAKQICETFNGSRDFPTIKLDQDPDDLRQDLAELIGDLHSVANQSLEQIQFQIKKGYDEVKVDDVYTQYYVFAPLEENEQIAKLQKTYSEPELEFLKIICEHLINDRTDKMDTEINVTNLCIKGGCNSQKRKLTAMEATATVATFIADGYLTKRATTSHRTSSSKGRIGLGARLVLELDSWLASNEDLELENCESCKKVVVISVACQSKNCDTYYHRYCVTGKTKCSSCKQTIKLDGVAAKR